MIYVISCDDYYLCVMTVVRSAHYQVLNTIIVKVSAGQRVAKVAPDDVTSWYSTELSI